jgi:hypothetical protein
MAAASTNYTDIVLLLYTLFKLVVGNTALNAEMSDESE